MDHKPIIVSNKESSLTENIRELLEIVKLIGQQLISTIHIQKNLNQDPNLVQKDTLSEEISMLEEKIEIIARRLINLFNETTPYVVKPTDIPQAEDLLTEAEDLLTELGKAIYKTGKKNIDGGNWSEGLKDMETYLHIFRQLDDLDACADAIYQIGRVHQLMDNPDEARTRYRDALRLYQKTDNQEGIAACKAALGTISVQQGFINEGVKFLKDAKNFYSVHKDEKKAQNVDEILHFINQVREKQPT